MPSVSKKQEKFMAAAAHNKKFADKAGIPQKVAKEFHNADKKKTFKEFLNDLNDPLNENNTVEWNPNIGAEFKGQGGITRDVGSGDRAQRRLPNVAGRQSIQNGDIALVNNPNGKLIPFKVEQIDDGRVVLSNQRLGFRTQHPINAFEKAPHHIAQQFKNPQTVWVLNPNADR